MSHPILDDEQEAPLDAAQLRLQKKLRRLLIGSFGIMLLGFLALFAVIIHRFYYRGGETASTAAAAPRTPSSALEGSLAASLDLPAGARLAEARLDGDRLLVTLETPEGGQVLIVDLVTLKTLRRLDLVRPR